MPKISVLIPAYNVERYIARCLDSVIAQTFRDIEIIIVNDGSTDGTAAIIDEYAARDSRIKVINHPENCGLMWVRKTCVEASSGDYLMFVDSDDALKLDACESLYSTAIETGSDLVIGGYELRRFSGRIESFFNALNYGDTAEGFIKAMLKDETKRYIWARLYLRSLFIDHPLRFFIHHNLMEDEVISYQVARRVRKAVCVPVIVYEYYENYGSLTHRYPPDAIECVLRSQAVVYDVAKEYGDEIRSLAETIIMKRVCFLIQANGSKDRRRIMRDAGEKGLSHLFSMRSLISHLGLRKGFNYYLLTHSGVISRIVFKA